MFTVFLNAQTDPNWWIAIAGMIGAFASMGVLIMTIRQARDARYLEFVNDTDKELAEHIEKGDGIDNSDKLITYAYNYVDICERILFLIDNGKVKKDFFEYYYDFLNYGVTMMWWYIIMYDDEHPITRTWRHMTNWIVNEQISKPIPYPIKHLPNRMIDELPKRGVEKKRTNLDKTTPTEIYEELKAKILTL